MPANTNPIFTLTPVIGQIVLSSANTGRDGTGTCPTVLTGGANGTRIHRITVTGAGTVTGGIVRLFIRSSSGSSTAQLWKEVAIPATTPSATVLCFSSVIELIGEKALILPSGVILCASTHNAETFHVIAEGGDY